MKANKLIIIALILTLSVVQIQTINIFNPYSETAKKYRCMSKIESTARVSVTGITAATYDHCRICRADKDSQGKNLSPEDGSGEGALGTFALRPTTKKYDAQIDCQKTLNEDKVKADYDSEHKIPRCELYDHYGQCVRCMIGYGLQWNSNALNGEEQGAYQCIDNQYRTPYCHKYDSSNKCIECKWNIDPEMVKLYGSNDTAKDQSYELDFALYEFNKVTYCINNRQKDPQLAGIDKDMDENKIEKNCASYDSERKCQRCHSRKFNLEGFKQYHDHLNKIDTKQNENYRKPIHDFILNKFNAAKPKCSTIPTWFVTKPDELDFQHDTSNSDSKCGTNKVLSIGPEPVSEYGCGTILDQCKYYKKDWDADYFQEQGVWVYKIIGCQTCKDGYALNESTLTCTEIAGDLTNCKSYNDGGCTSCTGTNAIVRITKNNKILATCGTAKKTITDCPDENVQLNINDKLRCTRCKPGFVIVRTDDNTDDTCTQITSYMQNANNSKFEEFKRGCTMINDKKVCVQDGGNLGYSENSRCAKGLLYDNVLCKTTGDTISGCEEYINVEGNIRCVKCESDRQINYSGTQCLATTSNNDVKNCAIMDGPWCRRCLRKQGAGEDIHYELTQWNTCVQIKSSATDAEKQCVYRNYQVSASGDIVPNAKCNLCTDQYYVDSGDCKMLPQYVTGTDTVAILLLDKRSGDRKTTWTQGKKVKEGNCLIYQDTDGNCAVCDRVKGKLQGVQADGSCKECDDGQTVKSNGTIMECVATVSENANPVTSNCLITNGSDCRVCEFGYERFIESGGDDECRNLYSYGCSEIQSDANEVCKTCVDPFVLNKDNKCVLMIENCISVDGDGACDLCEPGYELNGKGKCVQKTELCLTQDWEKSWDSVGNKKRANVCKTCFNIDGDNKDFIRLFKKGDVLYQGCLSGCEDQKLYRTMSNRSDANPYYLWSCKDCRNKNYHYYNTETRKQCEPAGVIADCNLYVNNSSNGDSLCHTCDTKHSIKDAGKSCEECDLVTECNTHDYSKAKTADGHCICKDCNANFYLSSNECKAVTTVSDCKNYSNSEDKCTECNANFFLSEGKCTGFTATKCATKSTTANECLTCIANHAKNDSGSCVELTGISNCKTYETSKLCKECDDGFGLNHDRTGCLDNSKTDEKRSQKCFQYGSTDVDDIDRKNQYPVCIKCYEGFALDYDHDNLEKQCVKAPYCLKGRYNKGNHITDNQTCQICQTTSDNKLVYKTKKDTDDTTVCQLPGTATNEIDNCRIYVDIGATPPRCYDCHDAYSPDSNDNTGSICISDDHPGALPGCKFYDNVNQQYGNADQTGWLKYEWLKCKTCEHEWRYHSAPADTTFSRYNYNTYTRDCDIVTVQAITVPAANTWSGKDGGLRTSGGNNPGTGDDDKPLPSDDREQYEDPVVFANILSYSAILLLIVMSVL